jgi:hypothetical protein
MQNAFFFKWCFLVNLLKYIQLWLFFSVLGEYEKYFWISFKYPYMNLLRYHFEWYFH